MKKLLALFVVFNLCTGYSLAMSDEANYNIKAIRSVKNAKTSAIRKEISQHRKNIEQIVLNSELTQTQKDEQCKAEEKIILDLYNKTKNIETQYKKDKKAIKKKY